MSDRQTEIHNKVSKKLIHEIVKPVIDAGGTTSSVMVVLESVVAGVLLACERIDDQAPAVTDGMLMGLEDGVRNRIAKLR